MTPTDREEEAGMVTVEAALGIAVLVAFLALLLGALSVVRVQTEVCQVVREAARAEAVGISAQSAVAQSNRSPLKVSVEARGEWVYVQVSAPAVSIGAASVGTISCEAHSYREPVSR